MIRSVLFGLPYVPTFRCDVGPSFVLTLLESPRTYLQLQRMFPCSSKVQGSHFFDRSGVYFDKCLAVSFSILMKKHKLRTQFILERMILSEEHGSIGIVNDHNFAIRIRTILFRSIGRHQFSFPLRLFFSHSRSGWARTITHT